MVKICSVRYLILCILVSFGFADDLRAGNWRFGLSGLLAEVENNHKKVDPMGNYSLVVDDSNNGDSANGLSGLVAWEHKNFGARFSIFAVKTKNHQANMDYTPLTDTSYGTTKTELSSRVYGVDLYGIFVIASNWRVIAGAGVHIHNVSLKQTVDYNSIFAISDYQAKAKASFLGVKYFIGLDYAFNRSTGLALELGQISGDVDEFELENSFDADQFSAGGEQTAGSPYRKMDSFNSVSNENITADVSATYLSLGFYVYY